MITGLAVGALTGYVVHSILKGRRKYPPCSTCGHVVLTHWGPSGECRADAFTASPCDCKERTI